MILTRLEIDNFKSLNDFDIDIHPFSVIVGNNASGKSSILQALDFMAQGVKSDFSNYLSDRNLRVDDIKSKLLPPTSRKIRFVSEYKDKDIVLTWEFEVLTLVGMNKLILAYEKVVNQSENRILMLYGGPEDYVLDEAGEKRSLPKGYDVGSSVMKLLGAKFKPAKEIVSLKNYLLASNSYELLAPIDMRTSSRGDSRVISKRGRNLPSFINSLSDKEKEKYIHKLQELLGNRFSDVRAKVNKRPGWIQIDSLEHYGNKEISVNSKEMSDGVLRILTFLAVCEFSSESSFILFDEIENGINTDYAEKLLKYFYSVSGCDRNIIVTTHSTAFLDYVKAKDIIFVYRDAKGNTCGKHIFEMEEFREKLDYMYPGEIVLNENNASIINSLLNKGEC